MGFGQLWILGLAALAALLAPRAAAQAAAPLKVCFLYFSEVGDLGWCVLFFFFFFSL
jgi:hypothetical protein